MLFGLNSSLADKGVMRIRSITVLTLVVFAVCGARVPCVAGGAAPRLPAVFGDHMVLQSGQPVPVWGWAEPNQAIVVDLRDGNGRPQSKKCRADANGSWSLLLDPLPPSAAPRSMTVYAGDGVEAGGVRIADILVGEVWLASGQSNMEVPLISTATGERDTALATDPAFRMLRVPVRAAAEPQSDAEGARWVPCTPSVARMFPAVPYYFARDLRCARGVPVGVVVAAFGGSRIEPWIPDCGARFALSTAALLHRQSSAAEAALRDGHGDATDRFSAGAGDAAIRKGSSPYAQPYYMRLQPHGLYNGMIAPVAPFAMRGVLWYQGESNAREPQDYAELLQTMIAGWRGVWESELPFLVVQIPSLRWIPPELREAQAVAARTTPRCALIVTTDVGSPEDIHPKLKEPVGVRLALAARALAYRDPVDWSGPVPQEAAAAGDGILLTFANAGTELSPQGGRALGFELAGPDGRFVAAIGAVTGATVFVRAKGVLEPSAVRYNWAPVAEGNLFNAAGLPAGPFRADLAPQP